MLRSRVIWVFTTKIYFHFFCYKAYLNLNFKHISEGYLLISLYSVGYNLIYNFTYKKSKVPKMQKKKQTSSYKRETGPSPSLTGPRSRTSMFSAGLQKKKTLPKKG